MPETSAILSASSFARSMARMKQPTEVPMPQPAHQMLGMRSTRRKASMGLVCPRTASVTSPPP